MIKNEFKSEWTTFLKALFSASVILPLMLTVSLFVGAYFAPGLWSTTLYLVTTLLFGFVATQFFKRFKLGMTKEELVLQNRLIGDFLKMIENTKISEQKNVIEYVVNKLHE